MNDSIKHKEHTFEKYITNSDILKKINELANEMNNDYKFKNPIFLGVLNGSIYFMMDLLKMIDFDYEIDFVKIKSYSGVTQGKLSFKYIDFNKFKDRNVIIVEDIIDSGRTIKLLYKKIFEFNPQSCQIITLLKKESIKHFDNRKIDHFCFEIKNKYVIGYGLDINNLFRNLKDIYIKNG